MFSLSVVYVEASTNSSYEHKLNTFLFTDYDRNVRPVIDPGTPIEVEFIIRLNKLVKVVNETDSFIYSFS